MITILSVQVVQKNNEKFANFYLTLTNFIIILTFITTYDKITCTDESRKKHDTVIEEIANIPYLDGCIFGLFDLSGLVGKSRGEWNDENISLVKHAISVLKK